MMKSSILIAVLLSIVASREYSMGLLVSDLNHVPTRSYKGFLKFIQVPDNFDSATQWPSCVHAIRD